MPWKVACLFLPKAIKFSLSTPLATPPSSDINSSSMEWRQKYGVLLLRWRPLRYTSATQDEPVSTFLVT